MFPLGSALLVFSMMYERESGQGIDDWLGCRGMVEVAVLIRRVEGWQCVLVSGGGVNGVVSELVSRG